MPVLLCWTTASLRYSRVRRSKLLPAIFGSQAARVRSIPCSSVARIVARGCRRRRGRIFCGARFAHRRLPTCAPLAMNSFFTMAFSPRAHVGTHHHWRWTCTDGVVIDWTLRYFDELEPTSSPELKGPFTSCCSHLGRLIFGSAD